MFCCRPRKPFLVYRATNAVNRSMIGTTSRAANASLQFMRNIATIIPAMESELATSVVTFWETAWLIASMSLVSLLISSPAGTRSKNDTGRVWRRPNRSRRRSFSDPCETEAMIHPATIWR